MEFDLYLAGVEEKQERFLVASSVNQHGEGTGFLHSPIDNVLNLSVRSQPAHIRKLGSFKLLSGEEVLFP